MTPTSTEQPPARGAPAPSGVRTPWGRFALLYAVFFLMGAEMYLVSPLLPTISHDLRSSTAAAAALVTSYVVTYAIAGPLLGVWADRVERRMFITWGVVLFVVGNVLCALAPTLPLLIAARAVTGLGGAAAAPAIWAYLAERSAPSQRGKAVSWGASIYSLGQVLGVPLGTLVAGLASWRWPFAAIGIGLACTVPVLTTRLRGARPTGGGRGFGAIVRPWADRRIRLGLLATALLQAGRLGTYTFAGVLFSGRFGLSLGELGLVGLLVGFASVVGSTLTGHLVDRVRQRGGQEIRLSVLWAGVFTAGVVVAVTATALWVSLAGLFAWFVAGGAFYSTQQSYLSTVDPTQRAAVVSWNNSMMNAGIAVGTSLLGALTVGGAGFAALAGAFGIAAASASIGVLAAAKKAEAPHQPDRLPAQRRATASHTTAEGQS
ncbi:MFS transporter [Streptomyces violascens]|uniref:MFS transporter n=1 Tax=Streptomyces violascens TaxID=67381 RepID=A0ABQ3QWF7_9ACTN|nr:MFS transporter [Streptomyces violascens]GHI41598.1 MFS transporter [Streptomyces violascens]